MSKPSKTGSGGGGYGSKVHVEPGYRQGAPRERVIPAGVYQYGQAVGNHVTGAEGGGGDLGYHGINPLPGKAGFPSELGNAKAVELSGSNAGCGKGRTVYAAGSQSAATDRAMPSNPPWDKSFPGKR